MRPWFMFAASLQPGAASVQLSGLATKAFNEARQRLEERGTREFCQVAGVFPLMAR